MLYLQVNLLKHKFGFNDAFNYKKKLDLEATLKRSTHLFIWILVPQGNKR
jgi:hypothetical protein